MAGTVSAAGSLLGVACIAGPLGYGGSQRHRHGHLHHEGAMRVAGRPVLHRGSGGQHRADARHDLKRYQLDWSVASITSRKRDTSRAQKLGLQAPHAIPEMPRRETPIRFFHLPSSW